MRPRAGCGSDRRIAIGGCVLPTCRRRDQFGLSRYSFLSMHNMENCRHGSRNIPTSLIRLPPATAAPIVRDDDGGLARWRPCRRVDCRCPCTRDLMALSSSGRKASARRSRRNIPTIECKCPAAIPQLLHARYRQHGSGFLKCPHSEALDRMTVIAARAPARWSRDRRAGCPIIGRASSLAVLSRKGLRQITLDRGADYLDDRLMRHRHQRRQLQHIPRISEAYRLRRDQRRDLARISFASA